MRLQVFWVFLLLFASINYAAAGTVTPTAIAPETRYSRPVILQTTDFSAAPPGCGTIAQNALVAKITDGATIQVALDADDATAKQFTCLRFDFTGSGKFSKDFTTALNFQPGSGDVTVGTVASHTFTVSLHGQQIPVFVSGGVQHSKDGYFAYLYITTAMESTCQFAGNNYSVCLVNSDGSLHCGNKWQLIAAQKGYARIGKNGDVLVIDPGAGKQTLQGFYGQPMQVDGTWYTMELNADATTLNATPFTAPVGTLQFNYPSWEAELVGEKYYFTLTGNSLTTTVPADNYQVVSFRGSPTPESKENGAWVTVAMTGNEGTGKEIVVAPTGKTHVGVGSGITAHINVTQDHRNITFALVFKDAMGNDVLGLSQTDGSDGTAKIPFAVVDAHGKYLYSNTFEHG